jgi:hypothetical protein
VLTNLCQAVKQVLFLKKEDSIGCGFSYCTFKIRQWLVFVSEAPIVIFSPNLAPNKSFPPLFSIKIPIPLRGEDFVSIKFFNTSNPDPFAAASTNLGSSKMAAGSSGRFLIFPKKQLLVNLVFNVFFRLFL